MSDTYETKRDAAAYEYSQTVPLTANFNRWAHAFCDGADWAIKFYIEETKKEFEAAYKKGLERLLSSEQEEN